MNEKSCITINCGYCGNENQEITIYNKNEHGEYWKHPDGTLVCCAKKSYVLNMTTPWGSLFESDNIELGEFPHKFIAPPHVWATSVGSSAFIEHLAGTTENQWGFTYFARTAAMQSTYSLELLAIGRWK